MRNMYNVESKGRNTSTTNVRIFAHHHGRSRCGRRSLVVSSHKSHTKTILRSKGMILRCYRTDECEMQQDSNARLIVYNTSECKLRSVSTVTPETRRQEETRVSSSQSPPSPTSTQPLLRAPRCLLAPRRAGTPPRRRRDRARSCGGCASRTTWGRRARSQR